MPSRYRWFADELRPATDQELTADAEFTQIYGDIEHDPPLEEIDLEEMWLVSNSGLSYKAWLEKTLLAITTKYNGLCDAIYSLSPVEDGNSTQGVDTPE